MINHVPLGTRCSSAFIIRDNLGVRKQSLPFDWIDLPVKNLVQFISLNGLTEDEFMERYFGEVSINTHGHPDGTTYPHDLYRQENKADEEVVRETKEKYLKRLKRLHSMFNNVEKFVFLTVIEKQNDENIEAYKSLRDEIIKKTTNCFFISVNVYPEECKFENGYNFFIRKEIEDHNFKIWELEIAKLILKTDETKIYFDLKEPEGIQGHCEDEEN